jgi:hypothetical protein
MVYDRSRGGSGGLGSSQTRATLASARPLHRPEDCETSSAGRSPTSRSSAAILGSRQTRASLASTWPLHRPEDCATRSAALSPTSRSSAAILGSKVPRVAPPRRGAPPRFWAQGKRGRPWLRGPNIRPPPPPYCFLSLFFTLPFSPSCYLSLSFSCAFVCLTTLYTDSSCQCRWAVTHQNEGRRRT